FYEASLRPPTYTKPILYAERARNDESRGAGRELNRLDIKNRKPLPASAERRIIGALREAWPGLDALVVQDQVSEAECGVVTSGVRTELQALGESQPDKLVLADSRERIGLFRSVCAKPNERECRQAVGDVAGTSDVEAGARVLAERLGR